MTAPVPVFTPFDARQGDSRNLSGLFTPLASDAASTVLQEQELAAAREAGRSEALAELRRAIDAFDATARQLSEESKRVDAQYRKDAAEFLRRVLEAAAPKIAVAAALSEIKALDGGGPPQESRAIEIAAHPSFCADLRAGLASSDAAVTPTFTGDESIPYGSIRARWTSGGMEADVAVVIEQIAAALAPERLQ